MGPMRPLSLSAVCHSAVLSKNRRGAACRRPGALLVAYQCGVGIEVQVGCVTVS